MKKRIPFGVWEPDSGAVTGLGRSTKTVNVVPVRGGYKAINGWNLASTISGTLNETASLLSPTGICGGFSAVWDQGGAAVVAGLDRSYDFVCDTTNIYVFNNTAAFSGTAPVLATGTTTGIELAGQSWRDFTQYGHYVVVASGAASLGGVPNNVSYYEIGSSTVFTSLGPSLAAYTCTRLRDFLVLGGTFDSTDNGRPSRVWWSAFGNLFDFTPSASTQSDFQDLNPSVGDVRRVLGGEDVFVICRNGSVFMEYVGGQVIMRFTYMSKIGTNHGESCVRVGDVVYFWSQAGFVAMDRGGGVNYIGSGRVNEEFSYLLKNVTGSSPLIPGYHDQENRCVAWRFGNGDGQSIAYCYDFDQWVVHGTSTDRAGVRWPYSSAISVPYGETNSYRRTINTVAGVASDKRLYAQNDIANKAKWEIATGFEELSPGRFSIVDKVWPVYDIRGASPTNPELVLTSIPKLNGVNLYAEPTSTYSSTAALQSDGFFTVTGPGGYEGRYHRFQLENSDTASERAGEQAILGLDVEYFERGNY